MSWFGFSARTNSQAAQQRTSRNVRHPCQIAFTLGNAPTFGKLNLMHGLSSVVTSGDGGANRWDKAPTAEMKLRCQD